MELLMRLGLVVALCCATEVRVVVLIVVLVGRDSLDEGLMIHLLGLVILIVVRSGRVRAVRIYLQLGESAGIQHGSLSSSASIHSTFTVHLCLLVLYLLLCGYIPYVGTDLMESVGWCKYLMGTLTPAEVDAIHSHSV
jgi:hypothetical protein